jgi:hypothetical protein
MSDECRHGMNPTWCSTCLGNDDRAYPGVQGSVAGGGVSEQQQFDRLCRQLGVPTQSVTAGTDLPLDVFEAAAQQCGVKTGSRSVIGKALAKQAGLTWGAACHRRATVNSSGPTVTREGLDVINRAVTQILARSQALART